MNTNIKKIILIFGGGLLVYWAFKKIMPVEGKTKKSSSTVSESKVVSEEEAKNAAVVLTAYSEAQKAGESVSFLGEMNQEFAKEFGLRVHKDKGSGKLFASDLKGNKIM
jgi:hypothetical protein